MVNLNLARNPDELNFEYDKKAPRAIQFHHCFNKMYQIFATTTAQDKQQIL